MKINQIDVLYRLNKNGLNKHCKGSAYETISVKDAILECTSVSNGNIMFHATQFTQLVFPAPQQMIFVSHLACDIERVKKIVQIIECRCPNVRCFIDSYFWENVYDAIEVLQSEYARKGENFYWHSECSVISKHMYLTLSMALIEAIKKSPIFVFIPPITEGSCCSTNKLVTESPWLALELLISSLLEEPMIKEAANGIPKMVNESVHFIHTSNTEHLHPVSLDVLIGVISKTNA